MLDSAATEELFSYGTLQLESVQRSTFGRKLDGRTDQLVGYPRDQVEIRDPAVVATSGLTHHPMLVWTGAQSDVVAGTVFLVTPAELAQADAYEVSDYRSERAALASGGLGLGLWGRKRSTRTDVRLNLQPALPACAL